MNMKITIVKDKVNSEATKKDIDIKFSPKLNHKRGGNLLLAIIESIFSVSQDF